MSNVFEQFDSVRIINLPYRKDRRSEMQRQLARFRLRGMFYPARQGDGSSLFSCPGARGCFLSHLSILREADAAGRSVLILEDDCDLLPEVANYAMPEGTDIFYGGYAARDPSDLHNSEIIGSHFMGFSPEAVKLAVEYLTKFQEPDFTPDARAAAEPSYNPSIRPGIDGAYVWFRRAHPELKTVFAQLSVQRPSRTDIGHQRLFDRVPIVRDLANFARRLKRRGSAFHVFD